MSHSRFNIPVDILALLRLKNYNELQKEELEYVSRFFEKEEYTLIREIMLKEFPEDYFLPLLSEEAAGKIWNLIEEKLQARKQVKDEPKTLSRISKRKRYFIAFLSLFLALAIVVFFTINRDFIFLTHNNPEAIMTDTSVSDSQVKEPQKAGKITALQDNISESFTTPEHLSSVQDSSLIASDSAHYSPDTLIMEKEKEMLENHSQMEKNQYFRLDDDMINILKTIW